jgi:hypothetical protein
MSHIKKGENKEKLQGLSAGILEKAGFAYAQNHARAAENFNLTFCVPLATLHFMMSPGLTVIVLV